MNSSRAWRRCHSYRYSSAAGNGFEPRSPDRRRCRTPLAAATREELHGMSPRRPVTCSCRPPITRASGARPRTPSCRRCRTRRVASQYLDRGHETAERRAIASRWLATRVDGAALTRSGRTPPPSPSPEPRVGRTAVRQTPGRNVAAWLAPAPPTPRRYMCCRIRPSAATRRSLGRRTDSCAVRVDPHLMCREAPGCSREEE